MSTPISPKNGFVAGPTAGISKPVRPSQPVATGVIATANEGKVSSKTVKG